MNALISSVASISAPEFISPNFTLPEVAPFTPSLDPEARAQVTIEALADMRAHVESEFGIRIAREETRESALLKNMRELKSSFASDYMLRCAITLGFGFAPLNLSFDSESKGKPIDEKAIGRARSILVRAAHSRDVSDDEHNGLLRGNVMSDEAQMNASATDIFYASMFVNNAYKAQEQGFPAFLGELQRFSTSSRYSPKDIAKRPEGFIRHSLKPETAGRQALLTRQALRFLGVCSVAEIAGDRVALVFDFSHPIARKFLR